MNERIRELADKVERIRDLYAIGPVHRDAVEHFAELIVRECAKIANDNFDKGFCPVGEFITNYFGIEE